VHCSPGGLKNFRDRNFVASSDGNNRWEDFGSTGGNKSTFYAAPANWLPVMKKWPNLRINFAHFGGGDQLDEGDTAWRDQIIEIINGCPNAYTDMAYYTRPGLAQKIAGILNANPLVKERLMFGTDYIMIMMDMHLGGLNTYFNNFDTLDDKVLNCNAKNFLK
jgi:predicted TIM-barrel fold metal-dependent hydrolase